jgi:hypothetical protein
MRERHDARCNRRRCTAARTARRMVQIPRITAGAKQFGLRIRHLAEFGRAGLAEDIQTRCFGQRDHGRILRGDEVTVVTAAHRHLQARHRSTEILDQIGHAGKRLMCAGVVSLIRAIRIVA